MKVVGFFNNIHCFMFSIIMALRKAKYLKCNRYIDVCGLDSVVGIATCYRLDGPGIESRWGARLSAPVRTGPGAHPASCMMGTRSFPGVKSGRGVTLTPNPLLVPWS